jgi:hypothetical protein
MVSVVGFLLDSFEKSHLTNHDLFKSMLGPPRWPGYIGVVIRDREVHGLESRG